MKVFFNSKEVELCDATLLSDFLSLQGIASQNGIAVVINNSVVTQKKWHEVYLSDRDTIQILVASQGG
ncbi:MAG: sulfur carrier protein ThiS [Phycisphaerales bacterium]|nr:sulfur carrier protein ThiS [Phycisphaerales bacterium]